MADLYSQKYTGEQSNSASVLALYLLPSGLFHANLTANPFESEQDHPSLGIGGCSYILFWFVLVNFTSSFIYENLTFGTGTRHKCAKLELAPPIPLVPVGTVATNQTDSNVAKQLAASP